MSNSTYIITLRVYVKEMVAFFKDNPEYGINPKKAYPADSFYELFSPSSTFYGSLRNIMVFQNNCTYKWVLESADGTLLKFSSTSEDAEMEMEMVVATPPTKEKWKTLFKFDGDPDVGADGKLKVKNKNKDEDVFELETSSDISKGGKIKYNFLFEFEDENGITKYGSIDPFADTTVPPPEWP